MRRTVNAKARFNSYSRGFTIKNGDISNKRAIHNIIRVHKDARDLTFDSCEMTEYGLQSVVLREWPKLTQISFNSCTMFFHISMYFKNDNFPILENIYINSGSLCNIIPIFNNFHKLTLLHINKNVMNVDGAKHLAKIKIIFMKDLQLQECQLGDQQMRFISVCQFPDLSKLNLSVNQIGTKGIKYLSQAYWPNVTSLNLKKNKIATSSIRLYLITSTFQMLNLLQLGYNAMKFEEIFHLSKLIYCQQLQNLRLNEFNNPKGSYNRRLKKYQKTKVLGVYRKMHKINSVWTD